MSESSHYIQAGSQQLHYLSTGSGKQLLLAFHGYGHDAESLLLFAPYLADKYTTLFIDLPHHGKSEWPDNDVFSRKALLSVTRDLMKACGVEKVSLMGYSMGGRVCCTLIEDMPDCIDKVVLMASDGLSLNPHYYFFTQTALGKMMFTSMLKGPELYFNFVSRMKKMGWINESQYKFVVHYLGDEPARLKLGQIWPCMSELMPDRKKVKAAIDNRNIKVDLFMGRYDRVMPPALAENFKSGLESVQLHILEKGHRVFGPDNAEMIAQTLL